MEYRNIRNRQWVRHTGPGPLKGQVGEVYALTKGTVWVRFLNRQERETPTGTQCFPHQLTSVTRREREIAQAAHAFGIKEATPCEQKTSSEGSGADGPCTTERPSL